MEEEINFRLGEYLDEEGNIVERIIGSRMKKRKVRFTDNTQQNVEIETTESDDVLTTRFMFRDSLKMSDQGFGSGYHKGTKVGHEAMRDYVRSPKTRKQKKFLNRPIWGMLARVMEIASVRLIDTTLNNHKVLTNAKKR